MEAINAYFCCNPHLRTHLITILVLVLGVLTAEVDVGSDSEDGGDFSGTKAFDPNSWDELFMGSYFNVMGATSHVSIL